jgi:hypothetical protein
MGGTPLKGGPKMVSKSGVPLKRGVPQKVCFETPKVGPKMTPKRGVKTHQKIDRKMGRKSDPKVTPKVGPKVGPKRVQKSIEKWGQKVTPKVGPKPPFWGGKRGGNGGYFWTPENDKKVTKKSKKCVFGPRNPKKCSKSALFGGFPGAFQMGND